MSSLLFWKEWSRPYRFIYIANLGLLFVSLLLFVVAWTRGLGNVIRWDVLSELNEFPITFHRFSDGLLDYAVGGKAYAVSEQFIASAMQVNPSLATGLLAGLGIAFVLLISASTRFDRVRYLIGTGLLILGLAFFRWEMLEIPGLGKNYVFLLLTFAFGSLSYYFHAFRPDLLIGVRIAAFGLLTGLVAIGMGLLSPVAFPALTLVSYGMPVLLVFSAGFIFFIAPEIVAGLVWLTTAVRPDSDDGTRTNQRALGIRNFLVVSALYLTNLVFIWLENTKLLDWDLLIINPFLIFVTSLMLGIWGFRRLIDQQNTVSFRDGGAYVYAGFALLTTLTMTYAFATANDPLVELFEDVIVYTHLAMGLFFVGYVLLNFWPMFQQYKPVHRILYKPKRLELSLFRVAGVFGLVVLLASGGLITVRQGVAGYFNGLGDLYTVSNEPNSASAFYQLALEQEFQNHKSNYALASLALRQNNQPGAAFFFQQATRKKPSPQAYAGLSQIYLQTDLFFEAVKALQAGLRTFPESGELQNNLGYLYARTSVADSAYYYLQSAAANSGRPEVAEANLLGFYARNPALLAADSSLSRTTESDYESYQANALALRLAGPAKRNAQAPVHPTWLTDSLQQGLSVGQFAGLYNYVIASSQLDKRLAGEIRQLLSNPANQDFSDDLLLSLAGAEYKTRQPSAAFDLLTQLADGDQQNGPVYRSINGLWLLEQGLYERAADAFSYNTDTASIYHRAIALTKAHDLPVAQGLWETAARQDPTVDALEQVLYTKRKPTTDLEKAFYVTYRTDDPNRGAYWETIGDGSLKTLAGTALANDYLDQLQWRNAQLVLSGLPNAKNLRVEALSARTLAAMRLSAFRRSVGSAETMARQLVLPRHQAERLYWLGQTYERVRQTGKAQQLYRQALQLAPLDARIVTATAQLDQQRGQRQQAYDLVLKALPYNPGASDLLKTYILLCLDLSLPAYADDALTKLRVATSPADYQAFMAAYQEKLALIENGRRKFVQ